MKRNILLLVILCLAAIFNLGFAQPGPESTPQIRKKTFAMVWQTVNDKFYDPNFRGVDWRAVHDRYAPQVAAVKTDAELYNTLNAMLSELKVSHMQILTPEQISASKAPPAATGVGLREIENQIVVTRVIEGSSAATAGIKPGYVIVKVGGDPVKSLVDAQRKLSGAANTTVDVSVLDEQNQSRHINLVRGALNQAVTGKTGGLFSSALFESRRLANNIGYLRFSTFASFLNQAIKDAIESMKDASGIIIDLRGNMGGEDTVAINLAGMLVDKETQLMVTRTRQGEDYYYKAKPQKNAFVGRVVLLVDEFSGSASEQLAAGLQEAGRATVIGKKTAGKDLDADVQKLPTGAYLIYASGEPHTPKGVVIEGRGVIPNVEVNLTRKELVVGNDTQLEAAINYIKTARP